MYVTGGSTPCVTKCRRLVGLKTKFNRGGVAWPLHDIAITNIVYGVWHK